MADVKRRFYAYTSQSEKNQSLFWFPRHIKKYELWRQDMAIENQTLSAYSEYLVRAIEKAAGYTVLVNGRRRFPASGILYAENFILTADHVVERDEDISVEFADGGNHPAAIAGRDPGSDLALLRLDSSSPKPAERVTGEARVGEIVIALGRPSQEGIEASLGIISAIGGPVRTGRGGLVERYLRTDVVPFPGFSGGPLINTEGKVVGLNTSGFTHGAAITIPAGLAWATAENLEKYGYVKRGYLGIRSQTVSVPGEMQKVLERNQETGLLIVHVEDGSPASAGNIMVGDILVGMDGKVITNHDMLMAGMTGQAVGEQVSLEVLRGGQPKTLTVKLGERK
jgi:S1-C subfamily serine protease